MYVADTGNNRILKEVPDSGAFLITGQTWPEFPYIPYVLAISGLNAPQDVAVDASGNLLIADTGNNRVLLATPSGTTYTVTTVASALNAPTSVSFDSDGKFYIADTGNNRVLKEAPAGAVYASSVVPGTFSGPKAVFAGQSGSVYIADTANNRAVLVAQGSAPSLNFASTAVDATSSDSPQVVTLTNIGNAALTFSIPASGNNPAISSGFSLNSSGGSACR